MEKRHFYDCAGETLSWQQEWYTQPWFTSLRQSYDRAASTGAVQPPLEIIETVGRCSSLLLQSASMTFSPTIPNGIQTTSQVVGSAISGGYVTPTTRTTVFTATATSSTIPTSSFASSYSDSRSPMTATADPSATALPDSAAFTNTCAGDWDWQAWGMTANLGFGVLVGVFLWISWAVLRTRIPAIYSGRTWYLPSQ